MGDRVTVDLYVLPEHVPEVERLLADKPEAIQHEEGQPSSLTFYEVNYGELDELYLLEKAGIAYCSRWGRGGEYGPGCTSIRFTPDGECIVISCYDEESMLELSTVMDMLLQGTAEEVVQALTDYTQKIYHDTTPLPWDNQAEYGKIYRAKQLITQSGVTRSQS